ncbi:hypothetical protein HHL08_09285 [Sphingobium sp. AR-3-1]|uniref:Phasin domain-containing protein n=1 Tax=Sphingobium psychrophilum TaxID=2728834 RepID=A0A7X9WUV6_9SPHN|nr:MULTISPECIES: hypothetical protein [Sphingobium]MCB4858715.1 hypothetical protein [Sphingobium sp. PNB]NML10341.1 hypothetical protein [Sphingobium psychrophilum]WCP12131.1 hypothetical protein sphantq_00528 [Sphingobium sp. AntQ-1]
MTYPLDQLTATSEANVRLATSMVETARQAGEDWMDLAGKAFTHVGKPAETNGKAGFLPFSLIAPGNLGEGVLASVNKSRERTTRTLASAWEAWQRSMADAWNPAKLLAGAARNAASANTQPAA